MWHIALISYFSASLDVLGVNVVRPHSSTVHQDLCPRVSLARKVGFQLGVKEQCSYIVAERITEREID